MDKVAEPTPVFLLRIKRQIEYGSKTRSLQTLVERCNKFLSNLINLIISVEHRLSQTALTGDDAGNKNGLINMRLQNATFRVSTNVESRHHKETKSETLLLIIS